MSRLHRMMWLLALLPVLGWMTFAQDDGVTVPDLTGLNVPQAAAALHRAGLRLGDQTQVIVAISAEASGRVTAQTPAAGSAAGAGAAVAVTVQLQETLLLVYDNNDMTLVNRAGRNIRLNALSLEAAGRAQTARFNIAPDWQTINNNSWGRFRGRLEPGQCVQIWSEPASDFKDIEQCGRGNNTAWMSTVLPQYHFWTGTNGATSFTVSYDGAEFATCPVARGEQLRVCPLAIPFGAGATTHTEYVYLTYTTGQLVVENPSVDRWMRLEGLVVQDGMALGSNSRYTRLPFIDTVSQLAPGECLRISSGDAADEPPPDCFVIAELTLTPDETAFWRRPFQFSGVTGRTCPPAHNTRDVICMVTY